MLPGTATIRGYQMKSLAYGILGIAALVSATAASAAGALPDGPYIIVPGSASTDVVPDYAVLSFSVDAASPKLADASVIVEKKAAKLFDVLKAYGVTQDDIRAGNLKANAAYDYDDKTNRQIYKGEELTRDFRVTLHDLSRFPDLIQDLLDHEITVDDVDFDSSKKADIEKKNLDAAIEDAWKRAEDMASQVGQHVDKVYGMAPGQYGSYINQEFPFRDQYPGLGKIEVTGTRVKRTDVYLVPKWITLSSNVTIVCTVK